MKLNAVLLDMGGVLLDLTGTGGLPPRRLDWRGREAMVRLLRRDGIRVSLDDLEAAVFGPWRRQWNRRYRRSAEADWSPHLALLRRGGAGPSDEDLLAAWFRPFAETIEPLPGARGALERMSDQGMRLALVSNVPLPGRLYREILERHGLLGRLEHLEFSYDAGHRKPSPALLRSALRVLGVPAAEALMVGDRRAVDIAAGMAAGVGTVWVRCDDPDGPAADWIVDSVVDLPQLVARLRSEG